MRGHIIKRLPDGNEYWIEPEDYWMKSLTDYGVEQLMNIINFYVSKNNILSFYTFEQIQEKMESIGYELVDKIFNEYEYFFFKPTLWDFVIKNFEDIKYYRNRYVDKGLKIPEEIITSFYYSYKEECENVRIKNLRSFPMIHQLVLNTIHAAYNRALQGLVSL